MTTAYSEKALNDLKKEMAHRAIKWALYQQPVQWDGNADEGFYGASWSGRLPPVSGPTGTITLKYYEPGLGFAAGAPPGAQPAGSGTDAAGQPYLAYEIDPWTSIYEPWIENIEMAFYGWDDIPSPDDFAGPITDLQEAVEALVVTPTGKGSSGDYDNAGLAGDLGFLRTWTSGAAYDRRASGNFLGAFCDAYGADRITAVLNNQMVGIAALGIALQGEQQIWTKAQADIMALAESAKDAFDGPGGGSDVDLTIVKALYDVGKNFLPPEVTAVVDTAESVASGAKTLLDALMPDKNPPDPKTEALQGWKPEEVLENVRTAVGDLNLKVSHQEQEIRDTTLQGLLDTMIGRDAQGHVTNTSRSEAAQNFDVHPAKGLEPGVQGTIAINVPNVARVGYKTMPSIAAAMARAAHDAERADQMAIWYRGGPIGMDTYGPYQTWDRCHEALDQVLTGSAKELVEAGRRLAVGAGKLGDADLWSKEILKGLKGDLDRGQYGWDNSASSLDGPKYTPYGTEIY